MTVRIAIVYHSGYGHTARVASSIAEGAQKLPNVRVDVLSVSALTEESWKTLDNADAIIFGAPTYMGGVSAKFKEFIDDASKRWMGQAWKNKIAAGFTNSGSYSGDKLSSLFQIALNALQHSMIWVGLDVMPAPGKKGDGPTGDQLNRLGSFMGLMTQSTNESPEITPPLGDIETAKLFGERVARITAQFIRGRE